jgi:hypothetical protein
MMPFYLPMILLRTNAGNHRISDGGDDGTSTKSLTEVIAYSMKVNVSPLVWAMKALRHAAVS